MKTPEAKTVKTLEFVKKIDLDLSSVSIVDTFVENNSEPGSVRIGKMDDNFKKLLSEFVGDHAPIGSRESLDKYKLNKTALDATILSAMGSEVKFCTLWDVSALLKLQPVGESGDMEIAADAIPHMFYVKDKSGDTWLVRLRFRTMRKQWNIELKSINDGLPWSGRNRFFYFKSS